MWLLRVLKGGWENLYLVLDIVKIHHYQHQWKALFLIRIFLNEFFKNCIPLWWNWKFIWEFRFKDRLTRPSTHQRDVKGVVDTKVAAKQIWPFLPLMNVNECTFTCWDWCFSLEWNFSFLSRYEFVRSIIVLCTHVPMYPCLLGTHYKLNQVLLQSVPAGVDSIVRVTVLTVLQYKLIPQDSKHRCSKQ